VVIVDYPRVVGREPGPGTISGDGDTLIADDGSRYRVVSDAEARMLRQGTGNTVRTLYPDGTIR
jgi:hypothetical protein